MLNHVKNIVLLIIILFVVSCKDKHQELLEERTNIYKNSISIIGEKEYYEVYKNANDSINNWIKNNLKDVRSLNPEYSIWMLDSLICFNKTLNKCFMVILNQSINPKAVMDDIEYFYGVKINKEWYFFVAPTLVIPREYYQDDIYTAIPFEKLKDIAVDEVFSNYLKKGEINNNFFKDFTSGAWGQASTQEKWDSIYLDIIKKNWENKN